ncbi:unnamed protein product [Angiostrongylus costaricensis]|uniref:MoCF_biosynth domain-containing protein n=1 Tax=Angiostrongylus costaricensis TaxID=334426 RepID=A0A0R3PXU5_ANGCS|nr:unnamed protein product [Angiostrongylus costaricensis]
MEAPSSQGVSTQYIKILRELYKNFTTRISPLYNDINIDVKRGISTIGDNVDDISDEIRTFSKRFDYVFTSGGVGPTHDDVTYLGLARAFDEELQKSSDIVSAIEQYFANSELSNKSAEFADKLSMIPKSAELLWSNCSLHGKQIRFPVVRLHNVIALPGVPIFCEQAFDEIKGQIFSLSLKPLFSETLYTSQDELRFAQQLSKIASIYDGVVEIGSYPVINNSFFKTKLILDSESAESGRAAADEVIRLLGG